MGNPKPIALEWDIPLRATTPRGWLFATREVFYTFTDQRTEKQETRRVLGDYPGDTYVTLGHYLMYPSITTGKPFHAVSCVSKRAEHFATDLEARTFIEGEARGKVAKFFGSTEHPYGSLLDKEEIRKLPVNETPVVRARS